MSEPSPRPVREPRPMTWSYSKVAGSPKSSDSDSSKSTRSISRLKPLQPNTKPHAKPTSPAASALPQTAGLFSAPPPATSMFSSLLQNHIQSPPVLIGAKASMNQTFRTSAEPSPESSEAAVSFHPPSPWGDSVPSRFTPTSQWKKDLRSTVQAAFSDAPEPQETLVSIPYS